MVVRWMIALMSCVIASTAANDSPIMLDHLGGDITLDCKDDGSSVSDFMYWVLPTNTTIGLNFSNYYLEVQNGGAQLALHELSIANIGKYMCVRESANNTIFVEMARPNLLEYYKNNIIVGVCATLGAALLLVGVYLVYHYRWRDDKNDSSYTMDHPVMSHTTAGNVNPSYDGEPVPIKSTMTESRM